MKTKQKPKHKSKTQAIVKRKTPEVLSLPAEVEQSLIEGNLANLTPEKRVQLYMATCKSLKLNPLTKPFCYILVSDWENDTEKLILYAARNCTDQLRAIYGITTVPGSLKQWREEGMLKASISMRMRSGRTDSDIGIIPMERYSKKRGQYKLQGLSLANAEMHVVTKAKRRATLSLCGLGGIVDETELDTMKVVGGTTPDGRIFRYDREDEDVSPRERAQAIASEKVAELTEKKANASQTPREPQPAPTEKKAAIVREVEVRVLASDAGFAVTGYLEDIQMTQFLADVSARSFKANADGRTWWQVEDQYKDGFFKLCAKLELKVMGAK